MTDIRTPCAVDSCHRSCRGVWAWWLCKSCYALVPKAVRGRHQRLKAYFRKRGEIEKGARSWWSTSRRAHRVMGAAGRCVIRAANTRARGL